ncbi:MAG: pyridoxamine 5'-phosphate oxidase family protein [Desulfovibrio sp.]
MRRKEREITDVSEIETILHETDYMVLSMMDGDVPYAVPVNFGFADGAIYFHSSIEGKKIELLRKNPQVFFTIVRDYTLSRGKKLAQYTSHYCSVAGRGKATCIDDNAEKVQALKLMMQDYAEWGDTELPEALLNKTLCVRIDIESMTGKKNRPES